ncbi:hypothetical protein [Actinomadura sp. NEAU-AAG7]|uniref:hypothetical protein n=1 Tax=Actinomadura sp. NEAU-AAG7 TaxID=2839640 RepID=UPI001BE45ADF|nr:hypothetical protein [Actinomadura sp. NEAU-AAG7]MBT2207086.1 hypothetical protein [Actinomadura sp. NEAU-AAG7]
MNGYAKADAHEGIEHGLAAQSLLPAFQPAHANERKINAWLATLPGPDDGPTAGHITPPAA